MNKKPIFSALIVVLYAAMVQIAYAESATDRLNMAAYRCVSVTEALQRVYVNLGGRRGFVQLDVPAANSQPVSISVLKQCLLQNGLMSKQEFSAYSQALETCRNEHNQQKVQFSRGGVTNISTSEPFNFDHCLQDNLVN